MTSVLDTPRVTDTEETLAGADTIVT